MTDNLPGELGSLDLWEPQPPLTPLLKLLGHREVLTSIIEVICYSAIKFLFLEAGGVFNGVA